MRLKTVMACQLWRNATSIIFSFISSKMKINDDANQEKRINAAKRSL